MEPTPTAALDRHNDRVYDSTTSVVRAVMALSQGVQAHHANLYLDLVKKVSRSFTMKLAKVRWTALIVTLLCRWGWSCGSCWRRWTV